MGETTGRTGEGAGHSRGIVPICSPSLSLSFYLSISFSLSLHILFISVLRPSRKAWGRHGERSKRFERVGWSEGHPV